MSQNAGLPEMPELELECSGNIEDGVTTVTAKEVNSGVELALQMPDMEDSTAEVADIMAKALPGIVVQVLGAMIAQGSGGEG